jgi:hypothetical protein
LWEEEFIEEKKKEQDMKVQNLDIVLNHLKNSLSIAEARKKTAE